MSAIEFTTELSGEGVLRIPDEVAARLPKAGKARIIVIAGEDDGDATWQVAAYQQFLSDDSPEDEVYDSLR